MAQEGVRVREWLAVALACGGLLGLAARTAWLGGIDPLIPGHPHEIVVAVSGAVALPGLYTVPKEYALPTLLSLSQPLPDADLSKDLKLSHPTSADVDCWALHIPSQSFVTVVLAGAVAKPGFYRFPKGSRISDIAAIVPLAPHAASSWLKRRRLIRDGETIIVPKDE